MRHSRKTKSKPLAKGTSPSTRKAVIPDDYTLQIDLDSHAALLTFRNRVRFFRARFRSYRNLSHWRFSVIVRRSSTHGHYHGLVTFTERLTQAERGWAQALLGDDPNRGIYGFFRHLNGSRYPFLFFEKER